MIDRRQFFRTSLVGGAAALVGGKLHATSAQPANFPDDEIPAKKGKPVLGLRCKPLSTVRIGIVGLGRGGGAVDRLCHIEGTEIVAL
ncbi:MAG: twin-arginine translocation signal domain-containing protein [Prevotellaceae bacterium]|jgi:hypothetical protein|nr:twin-arginine translocation signal domain-containing protein [Prevotellaceae bacterium]